MNASKGIFRIGGGVTAARGFSASAARAGIKDSSNPSTKPDLGLIVSDRPCASAGMFTTNAVRASCVEWNRALLPSSTARVIVCNSGNANACTGSQGARDTGELATLAARACGCTAESVLVAATGVIGWPLPMQCIREAFGPLAQSLTKAKSGGDAFAHAIMTTDTRSKQAARRVRSAEGDYVIGGCAKGSGMINPNMATLLAFVTTDAVVSAGQLRTVLKRVVDQTFNNLTIDGDMSTNDMILVLAGGASGVRIGPDRRPQFEEALFEVCNELCAKLAADGEGATKRIEIQVEGGRSREDAHKAAKAVAGSNLVKTAIFGNDPNWGRILCAIGYSGAAFSHSKIRVAIGRHDVCRALRPVTFPEKGMHKTLRSKVVPIHVDLGLGSHTAIAHTCDLTYDYVRINAEYTT